MAILEPSGAFNLRQQFYELLTDFATFPASQNFFLVNIKDVPGGPLSESGVITERNVRDLGIRTNSNVSPFGLDIAKNTIFKKYFNGYMFLATGVDLTTETTSVNNKGKLINGLLPVGPFMESRDYPDNDLDIQFSETNISIIDTIFRSWIQLYSVYGNMSDKPLSTDVTIYFISKQKPGLKDSPISTSPIGPGHSTWDAAIEASEGTSQFVSRPGYDTTPVVTKIYSYKDCIPYIIKSANIGQYDGDVQLGSVAVGWRFSRYDVRIPVYSNPNPPSSSGRPEFDDGSESFGGVDFNAFTEGNVGNQEEMERTDKIIKKQEREFWKDDQGNLMNTEEYWKNRSTALQKNLAGVQRKEDAEFAAQMNRVQEPFSELEPVSHTGPRREEHPIDTGLDLIDPDYPGHPYGGIAKRNAFDLQEPAPNLKPSHPNEPPQPDKSDLNSLKNIDTYPIESLVPPLLQEGLRDEVDDSENITTTHWTGIGVEPPTGTDDPPKSFVPANIQKGLRTGKDPEEDEDPGP